MSTLKTYLFPAHLDIQPGDASSRLINGVAINSMADVLLEIHLDDRLYYACWATGTIANDDFEFTPEGHSAFDALIRLDSRLCWERNQCSPILSCELRLGNLPSRQDVVKYLREQENHSSICFVGNIDDELDGQLWSIFNVQNLCMTNEEFNSRIEERQRRKNFIFDI